MKAIVVGAGIGGLTTAIALEAAGVDVTVVDRAAALVHVQTGGGLVLWANAMRPLQRLGLAEDVLAVSTPIEEFEFRATNGRQLWSWPVGDLGRKVGAPTVGIGRADLHAVLAARFGADRIRFDSSCTGFTQDGAGVTAHLGGAADESADVLVGADGLSSTIRAQLHPGAAARYSGQTVWQAILDREQGVTPARTFCRIWGRGAWAVYFPVAGGRPTWQIVENAPEGGRDDGPAKDALLERYGGWYEPLRALVAATDEEAISRGDTYHADPLPTWGEGRVTLVGDAAHPITPQVGQGAGLAIEDGAKLGRCLAATTDIGDAIREYEARRTERSARLVKVAIRLGVVSAWRNPVVCALRNQTLKLIEGTALRKQEQDMAYDI